MLTSILAFDTIVDNRLRGDDVWLHIQNPRTRTQHSVALHRLGSYANGMKMLK